MTNLTARALMDNFNCLYTDLCMLRDGEWEPDVSSCEDSIGMLNSAIGLLIDIGVLPVNYQPKDTRGE